MIRYDKNIAEFFFILWAMHRNLSIGIDSIVSSRGERNSVEFM